MTPTSDERRAAVGGLAGLSPTWRRLFDADSPEFQPKREAAPGDWLDERQELGQTFGHFAVAHRFLISPSRKTVYLQPVGDLGGEHGVKVATLQRFLAFYYQIRVRTLPQVAEADVLAGVRRQRGENGEPEFYVYDVLDRIAPQLPADGFAIVGVMVPRLFDDPESGPLAGRARMLDRSAVLSTRLLGTPGAGGAVADGAWRERRSCRVLAHEVGHLFGMRHCIYFECLMNGAANLAESDNRPLHLCPVCLRKACVATRSDPVVRYRDLGAHYLGRHDLFTGAEREWVSARLARARGEDGPPAPPPAAAAR